MHALRRLGLDQHPQLAVYKIGMTWPLETEGLQAFARGKRALLVVEEKRGFVESQIRDALYHLPADERPEVSGKTDPLRRATAVRADGTLAGKCRRRHGPVPRQGRAQSARPADACCGRTAGWVAQTSAGVLRRLPARDLDQAARRQLRQRRHRLPLHGPGRRTADPHLHPHGRRRRAVRRIGQRSPTSSTCSPISATAPTCTPGIMAIRQAVAAKTRMTYKLLFNDAVAMTGGQPAEGSAHRADARGAGRGRGRQAYRRRGGRGRSPAARRRPAARRHPPHPRGTGRGAKIAARLSKAPRC